LRLCASNSTTDLAVLWAAPAVPPGVERRRHASARDRSGRASPPWDERQQ
jgi:hypothetical protein